MPHFDVKLSELRQVAKDHFERSKNVAEKKGIPANEKLATGEKLSLHYKSQRYAESMVEAAPEECECVRAWGAIVAYDLRNSSQRALKYGPRTTYITMHTLVPVILAFLGKTNGRHFGLRGDGGIVGYGLIDLELNQGKSCSQIQSDNAIRLACQAAHGIIQVVELVVNPILKQGGLPSDLMMGVGIDVGEFVATNIGHEYTSELTAYGHCVNNACKNLPKGNNEIFISNDVKKLFPISRVGLARIRKHPDRRKLAYIVKYPANYTSIRLDVQNG